VAPTLAYTLRARELLATQPVVILNELHRRHRGEPLQIESWRATIDVLKSSFAALLLQRPEGAEWAVTFELELPFEGGRRPDICILTDLALLVVEVKNMDELPAAGFSQCRAYLRDFKSYHEGSEKLSVRGALLVTRDAGLHRTSGEVTAVGPDRFVDTLVDLPGNGPSASALESWLKSTFEPLPDIIRAAQEVFSVHGLAEFPEALSAGVPDALATVSQICERTLAARGHALIILSGTPGSGKTLVGLQFVHDFAEAKVGGRRATFFSGNGAVVDVLKTALGSSTFVKDAHAFIRDFVPAPDRVPKQAVLVFDEAQRAWDRKQVAAYHLKRGLILDGSEPELILSVASRREDGAVVIALIGQGQEIHKGEEGGVSEWFSAAEHANPRWTLHSAPRLSPPRDAVLHPELDLTRSLRAHRASRLHEWVDAVIQGRFSHAASLATGLHKAGYGLYLTDDLELAKRFLVERYETEPRKMYGLIGSSYAKSLPKFGVDNRYAAHLKPEGAGAWYVGRDGRPPLCRSLQQLATEFSSQGLELDAALLCWGDDFVWDGARWTGEVAAPEVTDAARITANRYRVLMTRARDSLVIFLPRDEVFVPTCERLLESGVLRLKRGHRAIPELDSQ